jgi:hypothetical protein
MRGSCRIACDDGSGLHVARHDRTCSDDRTLAEGDTAEDGRAGADRRSLPDHSALQRPVSLGLEAPVGRRRARAAVVDEHHPVSDEGLVVDLDTLADERVALDLAARADHRSSLDLDEGADPGAVADPAAVEVREGMDDDAFAELDVGDQAERRVVGRGVRNA